ncbi:MAG: hypothetical protein KF847_07535 [Pirellulales bacterium]|nr:hypothetical protein [Pirellulales bacterium]
MTCAPLLLVREAKISDLLPAASARKRFEASGVLAHRGELFVVFDDGTAVARLAADLRTCKTNALVGTAPLDQGYEGVAYNPRKRRFYLLVESVPVDERSGVHQAEIVEYSAALKFVKRRPLEFHFESRNKGFEALAFVRRGNSDYALALCEGNKCCGGKIGRQPGGGRIQLFAKKKAKWAHVGTVKLPRSLPFVDFSGMSLAKGRLAVVSQENSQLWVGAFQESTLQWRDEGRLYEFPRSPQGKIRYGNVEGVAWLSKRRIAVVSDRRKSDQPRRYAAQDQSVHLFEIPRKR